MIKDEPYQWGPSQEEAFQALKEPWIKEPLLIYLDLHEPFILDTDVSGYASGGVLSQVRDRTKKVVAYASQTMGGIIGFNVAPGTFLAIWRHDEND